jgi:hypothetical protein
MSGHSSQRLKHTPIKYPASTSPFSFPSFEVGSLSFFQSPLSQRIERINHLFDKGHMLVRLQCLDEIKLMVVNEHLEMDSDGWDCKYKSTSLLTARKDKPMHLFDNNDEFFIIIDHSLMKTYTTTEKIPQKTPHIFSFYTENAGTKAIPGRDGKADESEAENISELADKLSKKSQSSKNQFLQNSEVLCVGIDPLSIIGCGVVIREGKSISEEDIQRKIEPLQQVLANPKKSTRKPASDTIPIFIYNENNHELTPISQKNTNFSEIFSFFSSSSQPQSNLSPAKSTSAINNPNEQNYLYSKKYTDNDKEKLETFLEYANAVKEEEKGNNNAGLVYALIQKCVDNKNGRIGHLLVREFSQEIENIFQKINPILSYRAETQGTLPDTSSSILYDIRRLHALMDTYVICYNLEKNQGFSLRFPWSKPILSKDAQDALKDPDFPFTVRRQLVELTFSYNAPPLTAEEIGIFSMYIKSDMMGWTIVTTPKIKSIGARFCKDERYHLTPRVDTLIQHHHFSPQADTPAPQAADERIIKQYFSELFS